MVAWQITLIIAGIVAFISACLGLLWSSFHLDGDYAPIVRHFSIFCLIAGLLVIAFQLTKFLYQL